MLLDFFRSILKDRTLNSDTHNSMFSSLNQSPSIDLDLEKPSDDEIKDSPLLIHELDTLSPSTPQTETIDNDKHEDDSVQPIADKQDVGIGEDIDPLHLVEDQLNNTTNKKRRLTAGTNSTKSKKNKKHAATETIMFDNVIVSYTLDTMPDDLKKYWYQRHSYFSKFDQGILMDREGWFSVTPEPIAQHIAERCRSDVIIDAFCGCGGNTIQFALTCERVIAIDIDPVKLQCARHNAKIYGVEDRIEFILGSFYDLAPFLKADVVFLSPPWGGPTYLQETVYDLKTMMPGNGMSILKLATTISDHVAFFVPRNTNPNQLALLAGQGRFCEIERNYLGGTLKALTTYYGDYLPNWQKLETLTSKVESQETDEGGWV